MSNWHDWISINKELPKVGQFVLCASDLNEDVFTDMYYYSADGFKACSHPYVEPSVTHWIPLPTHPTALPEYVRLLTDKKMQCRGETMFHKAGDVFKVKTHGRTMTVFGSVIWQRFSYKDFEPATKEEFDLFSDQIKVKNV